MNLQEELTEPKLSEFIITIDLPIPPGKNYSTRIANGAGHRLYVIKYGPKDNTPIYNKLFFL